MDKIAFEAVKAAAVVMLMLAARYAVPYIREQLEGSKKEWILDWVWFAVRAAEQTISGDKKGEEKKAAVTGFIRGLLGKKGIALSDTQLDILIEAAVYAMNAEGAEL